MSQIVTYLMVILSKIGKIAFISIQFVKNRLKEVDKQCQYARNPWASSRWLWSRRISVVVKSWGCQPHKQRQSNASKDLDEQKKHFIFWVGRFHAPQVTSTSGFTFACKNFEKTLRVGYQMKDLGQEGLYKKLRLNNVCE